MRHPVATAAVLAFVWLAIEHAVAVDTPLSAQTVKVSRLAQNPLITVSSSPTLGGNVNGPSVIRVPEWIERPLGRYYLYFANHRGDFIRPAYSDSVAGPWKLHGPGVRQ